MRARLPHLATALIIAAGAACWSDVKSDEQQGTADTSGGIAPQAGQSGAALPGGTGPTQAVDTSGTPGDSAGASARDTTPATRPPR
jgi:hypothetical protein